MAALIGLATAFVNPFLALFVARELGASPTMLASFLFLTSVSGLVVGTFLGWLSDVRVTRRTLLLAGAASACCCYASFAVLRDYWSLLALSATLAAVGSTLIPQLFAHAREAMPPGDGGNAAFMISNLRTLISVGWVLGPPLAALLLDRAGFTGLFAVVALFYGLVAVLAARTVTGRSPARTAEDGPAADEAQDAGGRGRRAGVLRRDTLVAAVAFVALQTASALGVLALPLLMTEDLHGGVGAVGFTVGLAAALEIPLMPALGALAGRTSQRRLVCTGAVAGIGYYGAVAAAGGVWQVVVAQALSAVFVAGIMGVGISFFQDIMPDRIGSATTVYSNVTKLGSMAAGLLVGLAQATGYRAIFVVSAVLCALGLGLLLMPVRMRTGAARA